MDCFVCCYRCCLNEIVGPCKLHWQKICTGVAVLAYLVSGIWWGYRFLCAIEILLKNRTRETCADNSFGGYVYGTIVIPLMLVFMLTTAILIFTLAYIGTVHFCKKYSPARNQPPAPAPGDAPERAAASIPDPSTPLMPPRNAPAPAPVAAAAADPDSDAAARGVADSAQAARSDAHGDAGSNLERARLEREVAGVAKHFQELVALQTEQMAHQVHTID